MGWGIPEAGQQCYNSPMNSDLSGSPRAKMPFLGRTLGRGPTKIASVVQPSLVGCKCCCLFFFKNKRSLSKFAYGGDLGPAFASQEKEYWGRKREQTLSLLYRTEPNSSWIWYYWSPKKTIMVGASCDGQICDFLISTFCPYTNTSFC